MHIASEQFTEYVSCLDWMYTVNTSGDMVAVYGSELLGEIMKALSNHQPCIDKLRAAIHNLNVPTSELVQAHNFVVKYIARTHGASSADRLNDRHNLNIEKKKSDKRKKKKIKLGMAAGAQTTREMVKAESK